MKILIADDDTATRDFVARALASDGHEILQASDGVEAWAKFQAEDAIDLVLSDISMPGMDGVMLAKNLLDASTSVKIVMMSGLSSELERVAGLGNRDIQTLTKPFSLDDIRALVKGG